LPKLQTIQDEKFTKKYVAMAIMSRKADLIDPFALTICCWTEKLKNKEREHELLLYTKQRIIISAMCR
jgi:hypothetical protein